MMHTIYGTQETQALLRVVAGVFLLQWIPEAALSISGVSTAWCQVVAAWGEVANQLLVVALVLSGDVSKRIPAHLC